MNKAAGKKRFRLSYEQKNALRGYTFILPWLIGFLVFYVGCQVQLGQFSLLDIKIDAGTGVRQDIFVKFQNYIDAFTSHASFKQTLTSSIINMMIDLPMIIFFSLFVALLLNRKFKGRAVVRAIFFLPIILSSSAVGDAINRATQLMATGVASSTSEIAEAGSVSVSYYIQLFGDLALPESVLGYVVDAVNRIASIIKSSGVQIILFLAGQDDPRIFQLLHVEGDGGGRQIQALRQQLGIHLPLRQGLHDPEPGQVGKTLEDFQRFFLCHFPASGK